MAKSLALAAVALLVTLVSLTYTDGAPTPQEFPPGVSKDAVFRLAARAYKPGAKPGVAKGALDLSPALRPVGSVLAALGLEMTGTSLLGILGPGIPRELIPGA